MKDFNPSINDLMINTDLVAEHEIPSAAVLRGGAYLAFGKRALDITLVLLILPIALPLIVLIALLVATDGSNPFFGHNRVGKKGRSFRCLKLRTMRPDAEARLALVLATDPAARAEWAENVKLANDPRLTRYGGVLRKCSLDELPQLWNVLRGDMSIVGPRPVTRAELLRYGPAMPHYLALRPGVTGLWQVSGRNGISYAARVQLDKTYTQQISLGGDLKIIARTFGEVLRRTGQ